MNAKRAKMLRRAAGYRNQSKTAGVMDFPGISRAVKVPVFELHEAVKTSYVKLPLDDHFTKVHTKVRRFTLGQDHKPIMVLKTDGTPEFRLEVLSKPGVLRQVEPKGIYRQLKKLAAVAGMFKPGQATGMAHFLRATGAELA